MVGNYWPPTLESSVVDVCSQRKRLSAPPFSTRVCDCLYRYRTLLDIYIFDVYHSFFFGGKRATGIHTSSYQVRYQDTINTCHLSTLNTIYLPYFTVLRTSHKRTCGLVAITHDLKSGQQDTLCRCSYRYCKKKIARSSLRRHSSIFHL